MGKNSKAKKGKKFRTNMYQTLVMCAIMPVFIGATLITLTLTKQASNSLTVSMKHYMHSYTISQGVALNDTVVSKGKELALSRGTLDTLCKDIKLEGVDSSYCYVADSTGTMLWHPTADKIGKPVTNEAVKDVCAKMASGKQQENKTVEYEFNGSVKYASYYIAPDNSFVFVISSDKDDALAAIKKIKVIGWGIDIFTLIFFGTVAFILAYIINKPMKKVSESMEVLADGDLATEIKITSGVKEIQTIIDSAVTLRRSLMGAVGAVADSARSLNESVLVVADKTTHNSESIDQIADAVTEVADTSQNVATSAQEMAAKAVELGDSIETITANIENLRKASLEIGKINEEASKYMATVMDSSADSVKAVSNISNKINETNEAVTHISECVQMIEDISAQTNLLSLNASIEAARAGEAGKGFAVVADEIRKLADECAGSAGEIRDIVNKVIAISGETVDEAKKVGEIIDGEQKYINDTQAKFNILSGSVDQSIIEIGSIKEMTEGLNSIKNQITSSTSDLGAISEELGASAEEVAASCQSVATACTETQEKTEEMSEIEKKLGEAISVFKL